MLQHAAEGAVRPEKDENFWIHRTDGAAESSTECLANLCERLVRANMTAAGYRVTLDTLARLLRQGRTSEATTTIWMAARLGVHRNVITSAYQQAEREGLLRRIPVPVRGAPTRTALAGPALGIVAAVGKFPAAGATTANHWRAEDTGAGPASVTRLKRTAIPPVKARRAVSPGQDASQEQKGGAPRVEASSLIVTETLPRANPHRQPPPGQGDGKELTGRAPGTEVQRLATTETVRCAQEEPQPANQEPTTPHQDEAPEATPDPEVNRALMAKLGPDVMYRVMVHTPGTPFPMDDAWNLSDKERACLLALLPKPQRRAKRPAAPQPAAGAPKLAIHPDIATSAFSAFQRLAAKVGHARAGHVLDEIAYMVSEKGLGRGDMAGGVRAGVSLVLSGRWSTPRGMSSDWHGAVMRAAGDAQKTVH